LWRAFLLSDNLLMKKSVTIFSLLITLAGCQPPRDASRFISAEISSDGQTGIFVYKREVFYPGSMGLFFSGTPPVYLIDQNVIGTYDISSGKVRVLYRKDNEEWMPGGDFDIHSVFGNKALLAEGGQRRDYGEHDVKHYLLDLKTANLVPLSLKEDLAARGRDFGYYYLVDEKGTLIFVNKALPDAYKTSATEEIWLRRASGEYARISEVPSGSEGYYNFKDNEVHFYSAAQHAYMIYNLDTKVFRRGNPHDIPYRTYDQVIGFRVDDHGSPQPQIGRKIEGSWRYEEARIDTKSL